MILQELLQLNESGSITQTYRRLEAEFEKMKAEVEAAGLTLPKLEPQGSGNIWANIRTLEKNIEALKDIMSS